MKNLFTNFFKFDYYKFKENKDSDYYIILYRNDLMSYEEIGNLYTIDFNDYSTKKLKSEYPIYDAAQFSHMPMKRTGKGSWESMESYTYLMDYKVYENNEWCWGYRETDVLNGYDPYSNSKSCSELVTSSYRKSFLHPVGIAVSTARAGNVIGGGDFAENRIIPDCIRAATSGREIAIRSPHSVRPYQHVLEPLSANLLLAARQIDNPELSGCYNIGPDDTDCTTSEKLVQLFCRAWGYGATWRCINAVQPHEANFLKLDCSRITAVLGWQPLWHIEEAVQHTVAWAKAYYAGDNIAGLMEDQIREFGFGEVDRI